MGSHTSKPQLYPITLTGVGNTSSWTMEVENATSLLFQPVPPSANASLANSCKVSGNYDISTNTMYYTVDCPNSQDKETLANCIILGNGNIVCPRPSAEVENKFTSVALPTTSYLQQPNNSNQSSLFIWLIVLVIIVFTIVLINKNSK
jgi:hypothetical protein